MLDRTEIAILRVLEEDARLSYAELADKVALSKTPCWARVRDLEQRGVIKGYRTELDPGQLGLEIHAFIHATINPAKHAEFEAAAIRHRSVLQCFHHRGRRRLSPARAGAEHYAISIRSCARRSRACPASSAA
jgi:Lrp/AsnC family leucine-responsive transcriptional regulator